MARSYRGIHSPDLVRISYPPREPGGYWSSISLDPAMARLARAIWGEKWKDEVRQLAVFASDHNPLDTSISRAVQARIAEAAIERLDAYERTLSGSRPVQ